MASIEEKVEEHFKALLDDLEIRHFGKTEEINSSITKALKEADSKSGGSGVNYPDIQLLLQNKTRRDIPVMIEAKGTKGKLEKLTPGGDIELVSGGKNPNRAVQQFAVNGALHYGLAILDEGTYGEVITSASMVRCSKRVVSRTRRSRLTTCRRKTTEFRRSLLTSISCR